MFNLKMQSVTFTSLSPSMFENLELQFLVELSSVHGVVFRCCAQIITPLVLVGLGLGVGDGLGLGNHIAISRRGVIIWQGVENGYNTGTAPARINLMFWGECVVVSHCAGVEIYCLCLGIYDPNQNFHRILSSEQVTSLPRLFCPTEEKSITINHATNGD